MSAKPVICSFIAALILGGSFAQAQEEGRRPGGDGDRDRREEFMKRFDTNGDGQVSEEERQAGFEKFRQEREKQREDFMKRFDADGDGKLSDEERQNVAKTFRENREKQEALHKYDEDKDGILNDSEKAKMEADKKSQEEDRQARISEILKKFDTNSNGKIDADEMAGLKKHIQGIQSEMRAIGELARSLQESDGTTARALMEAVRPQDNGPRFGGPGGFDGGRDGGFPGGRPGGPGGGSR